MSQSPLRFCEIPEAEMLVRAKEFGLSLASRRSVRDFSSRPVPAGVIEECLKAANSAPNGANLQPWHFTVVRSPETKRVIRLAAEVEEQEFYQKRASPQWLETLAPLKTDAHKPFLEKAPALIAIFQKSTVTTPTGESKTY